MELNKTRPAMQMLIDADDNGWTEIESGIYLNSQQHIIMEQKTWHKEDMAKEFDFSTAPFYVSTPDDYFFDIHNVEDLLEVIANLRDEMAENAARK